jgi:hypothetical protein
MQKVDLKAMALHELEELQMDVEAQIHAVERAEKLAKKHTREEILGMFYHWGYIVPKGAKIWRLRDLEHQGAYGMEVGGFEHSCHVDSTDFKVLLVVDGDFHDVVSYSDMWFGELLVV